MRALKFKMVTPPFSTKYIYDWTLFFWGFYKSEMAKQKLGWDKNIYIPKKK